MRLRSQTHYFYQQFSFLYSVASSTVKLIDKSQTKYGDLKFTFLRKSHTMIIRHIKRIYASVNNVDSKSIKYSFYPDKIVKTTDTAQGTGYLLQYLMWQIEISILTAISFKDFPV